MKIYWSAEAFEGLKLINEYIEYHFSKRVAAEVLHSIRQRIKLLEKFPLSGLVDPVFSSPETEYRCVIKKYTKIVYRIENDSILIDRVIDMRMDPTRFQ